jgi:hypothetical protein
MARAVSLTGIAFFLLSPTSVWLRQDDVCRRAKTGPSRKAPASGISLRVGGRAFFFDRENYPKGPYARIVNPLFQNQYSLYYTAILD